MARRFSDQAFCETLQRLMDDQAVTFRGLAVEAGLSGGYLNHLVHGHRPVPSNDVLQAIAAALGVAPEYFREYRLRMIAERLEASPELIDPIYKSVVGAAA